MILPCILHRQRRVGCRRVEGNGKKNPERREDKRTVRRVEGGGKLRLGKERIAVDEERASRGEAGAGKVGDPREQRRGLYCRRLGQTGVVSRETEKANDGIGDDAVERGDVGMHCCRSY